MSDEPKIEGTEGGTPSMGVLSASAAPTAAEGGTPSMGVAAMPAAPPYKSFDVALVDPHNPAVEHWPRLRVTIDPASVDDLTADQRKPPAAGESAEAEARRLAFLVAEVERKRAIAAYNAAMHLDNSHLRYDVVPASGDPPILSKEWTEHLANIRK